MTSKKSAEPSRRGLAWGIASLVFFVLAVALIWCLVTMPASMDGVSGVIHGLGGSLSFFLPVIAVYLGILTGRKALGKGGSVIRGVLDVLVMLSVYAMVHVFYAEQVMSGMTLFTYANFVKFSYNLQLGGGAFGALLAFPAHIYLGAALGFVALLVLSLVLLAVNGRLNFFFNWLRERSDSGDYYEESPARPMPAGHRRKNERMFDADGNSLLDDMENVPGYLSRTPRKPRQPGQKRVSERDRERQLYNQAVPEAGRRPVRRPAPVPAPALVEEEPVRRPAKQGAPIGADAFLKADPVEGKSKQEKASAPKEAKAPEKKNNVPFASKTPTPAFEETEEEIDDIFTIEPEAYEKEEAPAPLPSFSKSKKVTAKKPAPVPAPDEEEEPEYDSFPPIDLLATGETKEVKINRGADIEKAHLLESTLKSFGIDAKLTGIAHGPAVTRFELAPAPGIKVSRITSLSDDIALNLAARSVRIEAPIPGKAAVGVEIPNDVIETVNLRDVLESSEARNHASRIAVGLGKDNSGRYIVADIAKMPHVLIAGQTGSGKSVCINSIIVSILYRATPKEVQLILIDPKVVELSIYNNIPHLITPVVTDPKKAASALDWAVAEMGRRYKKFADREVRDIKGYNKKLQPGEDPMPQIVIIIDELADLMMVVPGEVEDSICRLAQLARACGMHLVIATQRPSVNVITGIIKANIPSRIAFSVASQVDSRTMIDHGGAEKLLGNGDMLYVPSGINKPMRVQGSWVSDDEVHRVVEYVRTRSEPNYDPDLLEHMNKADLSDAEKDDVDNEFDPRLPEAVEIVVEAGQASTSMLQRRMRVGYARAGRLIDEMEIRGIVGEANGAKPRDVLISREEYLQMFKEDEEDEYDD